MNRTISAWRGVLASVVVIVSFSVRQAIAIEALLLQDTYVDNAATGTPVPNNTNFGANGDLRVGKNNTRIGRTFLKFSLATLPSGTTASDVKQARLVLWVNNSTTNLGSITMTPVTSAWDELILKNNNSLGLTFGSPKISNLPVSSASNFVSIDVTAWAKGWLNGTLTNEGFQIEPGASMTLLNLYFDSKESILTSHQPRLEIVLNSAGPQGPVGAQGLQGAPGPAGAIGPTGVTGLAGTTGPAGPAGQTGAPGPQGVAGTNGNKWFSSTGAPAQNLGALFDYYLDLSTGEVWQKVPNEGGPEWWVDGSIRGPQGTTGATGPAGAQGPAGVVGAQGPAGPQGNIGPQGIAGSAGDPGPVGPIGPAGPAAVWPTEIQPRGDLSMGEFTQGQTP
jgi:hypothetical protein